jgi:hypothetical protein
MHDHREIPLTVDAPVRRELLDGREVSIAIAAGMPGEEAGYASLDTVRAAGAVSQEELLRALSEHGAFVCAERGHSLEDLAQEIESGWKVIAFVNAGELWDRTDDPSLGGANHAVVVEGVVRDAHSQELCGFMALDPAVSDCAAFLSAEKAVRVWMDAGGWMIVPSRP